MTQSRSLLQRGTPVKSGDENAMSCVVGSRHSIQIGG